MMPPQNRPAADLPDEDTLAALEAELPLLFAMRQFIEQAVNIAWFSRLGAPPTPAVQLCARQFLDALGFPEAELAYVSDWHDAFHAAMTTDMNSAAWEAEEQSRAALVDLARAQASEEGLGVMLAFISAQLGDVLQDISDTLIPDTLLYDNHFADMDMHETMSELMPADVLVGAAQQAAYGAALVYGLQSLTDTDTDILDAHPLWLKYRLFAAGHWPISLIGQSFHLF